MQSNQNMVFDDIKIIDVSIFKNLYDKINKNTDIKVLNKYINSISKEFNIDTKNIIKDFLNYIIRNYKHLNTPEVFNVIENIINFEDGKSLHNINYLLIKLLQIQNNFELS
jgi:tRNA A-37 threonylcarbamoyl transferase component Bud32